MLFDFDRFRKIAAIVYPLETPYSFDEAMSVFWYFFEKYEEKTGEPHPPIKASQIARICQQMPYILEEGRGNNMADIDADAYPFLIDKYFKTPFKHCDYRICHFFSGRVRELRCYETGGM